MKYKKILLIILICFWMATIFIFSNQASQKSSNTSGQTIKYVLNKFSVTKEMNSNEEHELIEHIQPIIRKLAHFSIYMIGGIITFLFANEYNIDTKKKIIYSITFCVIYAVTDEIHQYFVPR